MHNMDPKVQYFSTFDCEKGYWQVPLEEECRNFTTFIFTLGNFRYTRAITGFISAVDGYNQRCGQVLKEINVITKNR